MIDRRAIVLFGLMTALPVFSCGLTHDTDGLSKDYGADASGGSSEGGVGGSGAATGGTGGTSGTGATGATGGVAASGGGSGGVTTGGTGGSGGGTNCGNAGEPCCSGGSCETSTSLQLACNPSSNVCEPCGTKDAICCGGACDPGHVCSGGFCRCGGKDQPCCAGSACDASLACVGGFCKCGDTGQPCCADNNPACYGAGNKTACCTGCSGNQCSCSGTAAAGGECKICCVVCTGPYHKPFPEDTAPYGYSCAQAATAWCQANKSTTANQTQTGWKLPDSQGNCPG